jgi:hypothetical protein
VKFNVAQTFGITHGVYVIYGKCCKSVSVEILRAIISDMTPYSVAEIYTSFEGMSTYIFRVVILSCLAYCSSLAYVPIYKTGTS